MKRYSFTLLAVFIIAANSIFAQNEVASGKTPAVAAIPQDPGAQILNAAQVAKLDLTGKWSGKRNQYSWDKKTFIESFQYEFDLKQEGNLVTGTSTIMNANGEFADMKLEGFIIGNKLHFREYQVQDAIRPQGMVWCFKSGELNFTKVGNDIKLTGSTPSFMEVYNYPCSGGETDLQKVDNSTNLSVLSEPAPATDAKVESAINISAYPNPFTDNANIGYNLTADNSNVKVEIYDISGKFVTNLFEGNQNAGNYTYNFSGKNYSSMSGIYVAKITINNAVYSQQLVQVR